MIKISKEIKKELSGIVEKADELKRDIRTLSEFEKLKDEILRENSEWIVESAYENCGGSFDGRVYLDIETGELISKTMTNNTYIRESNWIMIYELSSNWMSNAIIRVNDILDDEEWEKLKKEFGEEQADYMDRRQLNEIGIIFDDRMKEALQFWLD